MQSVVSLEVYLPNATSPVLHECMQRSFFNLMKHTGISRGVQKDQKSMHLIAIIDFSGTHRLILTSAIEYEQ